MNATLLLIEGPHTKELSLTEDLKMGPHSAKEWFHILHNVLKPHLLQIGHKHAYLCLFQLGEGFMSGSTKVIPVAKGINEDWLKSYLTGAPYKGGSLGKPQSLNWVVLVEIRNDQLFCTKPYSKDTKEMQLHYHSKGFEVLAP